jgi:hypothetical protein
MDVSSGNPTESNFLDIAVSIGSRQRSQALAFALGLAVTCFGAALFFSRFFSDH